MIFAKYSTVENASKEILQLLEQLINIFDHHNEYNTVGLPINVEVFQ